MVKKKMHLMKMLTAALLILGWLLAASLLFADGDEEKQAKQVAIAEEYYADRLYMRAVNVYQSAINDYKTDKNAEIESRILSIYKEIGKMEEYYALAENRIAAGTASEQEYLDVADMYAESGSIQQEIPVLLAGMEVYGEENFIERYNASAFGVDAMVTGLETLLLPGDNGTIPYTTDEGIGYMTSGVKEYLPASYEEAFPFSGGYAVVKTEGNYVLIDSLGDWYAVDKTGIETVAGYAGNYIVAKKGSAYALYTYTFSPITEFVYEDACISDNGICFVKQDGKWGAINGTGEQTIDFIYEDIAVNSRSQVFAGGYAVVKDADGWLIINESGEPLSEVRYSDAKGMEGSWVAVADKNGKWGFTDGVEEKISCQYEDAYSFSDKLAAVMYGDKWGYITPNNTMAVEPSYEETFPFYNGMALAKKNGIFEILKLKYYEVMGK